ncbi:hypothetical protein MHN79_00995 [Vibrio sp. Of14-4]|uniref:hypothetical protein n=1 Tax=Vibrio sp. Of14-4 TaxID=2724878 RepID=UPI001EF2C507|nr:hypothetical protein [Vibrio sp. Of14-4]MCG7488053.1 hypothetical protein [Vibrio sp. Of14-4]
MNIRKLSYLAAILVSSSALAESTFVIDAGSSGSRLFEYQYHQDTSSDHGLPVIDEQIKHQSIKGGVQTIKEENLDNYIDSLFAETKTTPDHLYFYSTAGMRTISSTERNLINQRVKDALAKRFPDADIKVKTITGQTEGAYAWLAANYYDESFINDQKTKGIMDLGGASTQITFETNTGDDLINVNVGNLNYTLSSTSYLGLGQNLAISKYFNQAACFPKNYPLPNDQLGTGKFGECAEKVEPLINGVQSVSAKNAQSETSTDFYAISGFFFNSSELGINDTYSLSKLEEAGKDFCSQNWEDVEQGKTDYEFNPHLYAGCFNAAYQHTLITKGYQLTDDTNNITPVRELKGNTISWTLGPVLAPDL